MVKIENLTARFNQSVEQLTMILTQDGTFHQLIAIVAIYLLAYMITRFLCTNIPIIRNASLSLESPVARLLERIGKLIFPITVIILLKISLVFSPYFIEGSWVMESAQAIALLLLFLHFYWPAYYKPVCG